MIEAFNPPLRVLELIAPRVTEPARTTMIWMNAADARMRSLTDGELVWVYGPRRHELAGLEVDDTIPRGHCILRNVAGASPSEVVTVRKVEDDSATDRSQYA